MKKVVLSVAAVLMIAAIAIQVYAIGGVRSKFVNEYEQQWWECPSKENSHNGKCWICSNPEEGCTDQYVSAACGYCIDYYAPACKAEYDGGDCDDFLTP